MKTVEKASPPLSSVKPLRLASRMSRLGSESAFEVLARARALEQQGREIIHLEIGEPDFATPSNITEAAVEALHEGWTHYGPTAGLPQLREAIAEYVTRTRGVPVSPSEVVVVPGGKPIIFYTILALVEAGDEVIYPNPGFPIYESMTEFVGARPVPLRSPEEREFRHDPNELARLISDRTRLLILNSPHNPTGGVLTAEDLRGIAGAIGDRNIMVLSDEIYSRLVFEGSHHSILSLPGWKDRTILLDGFSKTYAMTGWRLGFGVMRADLAAQVTRLVSNCHSCTASFVQRAGIEALRGDPSSVAAMCEQFRRRRDFVVERLNRVRGFSCRSPRGAFYAYPSIMATGWPSKKLADALLEEAGIACLAGTAFGHFGEGYLRFSVANSMENLAKAMERLEDWAARNIGTTQ